MNQISFDKSRRLDIIIRQGETLDRVLKFKNPDGSAYDFTGHTVELFVYHGRREALRFTSASGLTITGGDIRLQKTSDQTKDLAATEYMYFMWVTTAGTKRLWLNGQLTVNENLFDGITDTEELTISPAGDTINITVQQFIFLTSGELSDLTEGLFNDRGDYDASGNVYPVTGGSGENGAIKRANVFKISSPGTLGADYVPAGCTIRALVDNPGQSDSNWLKTF